MTITEKIREALVPINREYKTWVSEREMLLEVIEMLEGQRDYTIKSGSAFTGRFNVGEQAIVAGNKAIIQLIKRSKT